MRARLYLVTPRRYDAAALVPQLAEALAAGDVASLLVTDPGDGGLQAAAECLTPVAQAAGVAVLVAEDSRAMGRAKADGIHVAGLPALAEALDRLAGRAIVGAGGLKTRHEAMEAAEAGADYVFFGLLDRDDDEEVHRKTLDLAGWWAPLFETPCVALAGHRLSSVTDCARTGAEFVALRDAVWSHPEGAAEAVRQANGLIDLVAADRPRDE